MHGAGWVGVCLTVGCLPDSLEHAWWNWVSATKCEPLECQDSWVSAMYVGASGNARNDLNPKRAHVREPVRFKRTLQSRERSEPRQGPWMQGPLEGSPPKVHVPTMQQAIVFLPGCTMHVEMHRITSNRPRSSPLQISHHYPCHHCPCTFIPSVIYFFFGFFAFLSFSIGLSFLGLSFWLLFIRFWCAFAIADDILVCRTWYAFATLLLVILAFAFATANDISCAASSPEIRCA